MKYLQAKDIIRLNQKVLSKVENYPTKFADAGSKELLDSIVNKAKTKSNPSEVATIYMHDLNLGHVFKSGNKRTSFLAGELFLSRNGIMLDLTDQEAVTLSKNIRNSRIAEEELRKYIEEKSRKRTRNYAYA